MLRKLLKFLCFVMVVELIVPVMILVQDWNSPNLVVPFTPQIEMSYTIGSLYTMQLYYLHGLTVNSEPFSLETLH